MLRTAMAAWIGCWFACALSGCAHVLETEAIEAFTFALQDGDVAELQRTTSDEFESKALRRAEALDDLQILRLPKEPPTVVQVVDVSETEKHVNVTVGNSPQQLLYKLVQDPESKQWVVDDIFMKQKRKGLKVTKSVTEQMDLLLTVRDFIAAWETGGREDVLHVTTPDLSKQLADLPPAYLQQLVRRVMGDPGKQQRRARPDAQLDDDVAIVTLPRLNGNLVLSMRLQNATWRVSDIALDAHGDADAIKSVAKTATLMNSALAFLNAYERQDKPALQKVSTEKFYRQSLLPAELALVPLPEADRAPSDFEVSLYGDNASFVLTDENQTINIDLLRPINQDGELADNYLVAEVTVYEDGSDERKRLSALFTSRDRVRIFADALNRGDLDMLRSICTPEFNERVWDQVDSVLFHILPLPALQISQQSFGQSRFLGDFTEVTTTGPAGETIVFRLRDWNGELGIDDLMMASARQPSSLRNRLEVLVPLYKFARGVHHEQVDQLQRYSSSDFNRLIWRQLNFVPEIGFPIVRHLEAPPNVIAITGDRAQIQLGDDRWGARARMVRERDYWVVDELQLIAGPQPNQRTEVKETMRVKMASGQLNEKMRQAGFSGNAPAGSTLPTTGLPSWPVRSEADGLRQTASRPAPLATAQPTRERSDPSETATADVFEQSKDRGAFAASEAVGESKRLESADGADLSNESLMPPIDIPLQ